MTSTTASPASVVTELSRGRLRWDLLRDFPREDPVGAARGDDAIRHLDELLARTVDPDAVERDRALPAAYLDALRASGYLRLQLDPAQHGLGLADFATFRVCAAAMQHSTAAGFVLATHNGIGLPALLPALPAGPVRDLVVRRLADGALSGWADTEPIGASNDLPRTVAEPCGDGGYQLTGDKVFISNGTIADELIVSAVVSAVVPGAPGACLFLVSTRSPGFRVRAAQEVIGLKGLPLGALHLDRVFVTPDRVLVGPGGPGAHWRGPGLFEPISSRGRTYLVSGAALAIARRAVAYQRDFIARRSVDGRALGSLPAIRDLFAGSLADVFAIEAVVAWCLIGGDADLAARHRDRLAAKNITTLACWRVVEATMSLCAAEGAETWASKRGRGAPPLPIEQLLRDARVLRITGGVDFAVDLWAGQALFTRDAQAERGAIAGADLTDADLATLRDARLTPRNAQHLQKLAVHTRRFARTCAQRYRHTPDLPALLEPQARVIAAGRIARELFTMAVVLGRASLTAQGHLDQRLASVYCDSAMARLPALWPALIDDTGEHDAEVEALCARTYRPIQ